MIEQENETKKLTIVIAGRSYPVKVSREDALILPAVEKELNEQIRQMQLSYKDKDLQDCLSMVLLTKAIAAQTKAHSKETNIEQKIDALNIEIETVLK